MNKRKSYTPELKVEAVLRVLKEEITLAQIASEFEIHPVLLTKWKTQFLQNASIAFKNDQKPVNEMKAKYEKQVDELYKEIGRLTTRLNWLKKKSGIELD
jgi:transposase